MNIDSDICTQARSYKDDDRRGLVQNFLECTWSIIMSTIQQWKGVIEYEVK